MGERREKRESAVTNGWRVFPSACAGRNFGFFLDQLAKDGRDLFKISGLVEEQICSRRQTFFAIFGIGEAGADDDIKVRMIVPNGTQNIQAAAARHMQIENQCIRFHFLDADYRGRYIACPTYKPCARDLFEKSREAFYDYPGVVSDKDFHIHSFMNGVTQIRCPTTGNDESAGKSIGWNHESCVGRWEGALTAIVLRD